MGKDPQRSAALLRCPTGAESGVAKKYLLWILSPHLACFWPRIWISAVWVQCPGHFCLNHRAEPNDGTDDLNVQAFERSNVFLGLQKLELQLPWSVRKGPMRFMDVTKLVICEDITFAEPLSASPDAKGVKPLRSKRACSSRQLGHKKIFAHGLSWWAPLFRSRCRLPNV